MTKQIPPHIKIKAEYLIQQAEKWVKIFPKEEPVAVLLRRCRNCKNGHELLPFVIAINSYEPQFEIPKAPMWQEAARIAAAYTPLKSESANNAPIFSKYDQPPSEATQKQMHRFIEKHGYSRQVPRAVAVDKDGRNRFDDDLGY